MPGALSVRAPPEHGLPYIARLYGQVQDFQRREVGKATALLGQSGHGMRPVLFQPLVERMVGVFPVVNALGNPCLGIFAGGQAVDFGAGQRVGRIDQAAQAGQGQAAFRSCEQPAALVTNGWTVRVHTRSARSVGFFLRRCRAPLPAHRSVRSAPEAVRR